MDWKHDIISKRTTCVVRFKDAKSEFVVPSDMFLAGSSQREVFRLGRQHLAQLQEEDRKTEAAIKKLLS